MSRNIHPQLFGGRNLGNSPEMRAVFDQVEKWQATTADFVKTTKLLADDAKRAISAFNSKPNDALRRRQVIRNVFALFEGQVFLMKRICLERIEQFEIEFTRAELVFLREEKYFLDGDGKAHTQQDNYPTFTANYQFTFKSFATAHGGGWSVEQSRVNELRNLGRVRNRLMHPKRFDDLQVTDTEIKLAEKVLSWHIAQTSAVLTIISKGEKLDVKNLVEGVGYHFDASMPVFLIWRNGDVYEFPTKAKATRFARAKGGSKSKHEFTIVSIQDALEQI